jgi:hypothetical protein
MKINIKRPSTEEIFIVKVEKDGGIKDYNYSHKFIMIWPSPAMNLSGTNNKVP